MKLTNRTMIISGSTIETYHYKESPLFYDYEMPNTKKSPILVVDEESLQRKIESRKSSQKRSRSVLRRLVNTNAWKWHKENNKAFIPVFLTFTFAENVKDIKVANLIFSKFIKRFNYEITKEKKSFLKYVVVTEFQKRGAVHFHAIFFNLKHIWADKIKEIWGQGFIKLKKINHVDNVGAYISKYMVKHFDDDRLDGKKRYFSSVGLMKPTVIKEEEIVLKIIKRIPEKYFKHASEYERKARGKKIGMVAYAQYKLDKKESIFDIIPELKKIS